MSLPIFILIFTLLSLTNPSHPWPTITKPVIVALPGAWVTSIQFHPFIETLQSKGYPSQAFTLPSVNSPDPASDTVASDATYIHDILCALVGDLELDVVLLTHSYAGVPGNVAANLPTGEGKPLAKVARRAQGLKGGIIGMVLVTSFAIKEGQTLLDFLPEERWLPWFQGEDNNLQISISNPQKVFFNDLPPTTAAPYIATLGLTSASAFTSPSGPPAWADEANYCGRRVFIKTLRDQALIPAAQDGVRNATGVHWDLKTVDSGHMPFVSHTDSIVGEVVDAVRGFESLP